MGEDVNNLAEEILDMSYGYPEHGAVMDHLIAEIFPYLRKTRCNVMREQLFRWPEDDSIKGRMPDISILCNDRRRKGLAFTGTPRFIAEVLSDSTEADDRGAKMNLYCRVGVEEYWIIDWRKKSVERYLLNDTADNYILHDIIREDNKQELALLCLPMIKLDFDEIFDFEKYTEI